jgi:hypothetical protein
MAHNQGEDEQELAGGIFPIGDYEAAPRTQKDFLPWHRPRKQFVRQWQWCELIRKVIESHTPESGYLKYLGLPGSDLLDIRYLHNAICEPLDIRLKFLGFNTAARASDSGQTDLNISLDEVRKLPHIDPSSDIIADNFCLLANEASVAWDRTREYGPYDIVNLDLCDGFAKHQPGTLDNNHYNSLNQLLTLQSGKKTPWLLFLTTRTDPCVVNEETLQKLVDKYVDNINTSPQFLEKSRSELCISNEEELVKAIKTPNGHLSIFLTGLSKWLIGLGLNRNPPFTVSVPSIHCYKVAETSPCNDLVSIAFRFDPTFIASSDPMGIATSNAALPIEGVLATRALQRVINRKCVDTILADCSDTMTKMIESTAELLDLARYDISAYREWLAQSDQGLKRGA